MFDNIKPAITSKIVMLKCLKKLPSLIRPQIVLQILLGLEKRKVFMMPTLDKNSHKNRKNKIIKNLETIINIFYFFIFFKYIKCSKL